MQWSEIWGNFKKMLDSLIVRENYILIIYFSLLFIILIFAIYPFMNLININVTMNIYKYILAGSILTLFILFLYIFKELNIGTNFFSIIIGIETFSVVIILLLITYKHLLENFQLSGELAWSLLNVGVILGFTIYFFYSFWKCYNEKDITGLSCDTNLFYSWTIWSILISIFIGLSLFFTSLGLNDWPVFAKQTIVYFMIVLFVFIILLNNNSITGGKLVKKSQLVTSNSILQTLLKFFCIICILILTQVFLKYTTDPTDPEKSWKIIAFIPIAMIILNIIPFVFNNLQTWIDKIILYPLLFLLFFGLIFFVVGGLNIFKFGYNLVVIFLNNIFSRNEKLFDVKFASNFGLLFHAIIFIYIYGFTIFLLFVYNKYVNEAKKNNETLSDAYDNFKQWYSSNWWLWIGFVLCYMALSGISNFADYLFGLFGAEVKISNINDSVQIGKIPVTLKNIEGFFKIVAILITCSYLFILYYDIFNKNTDWSNFLNGQTPQLYINAISIILIIGILIFSLTRYTKNAPLIVIFILLTIIFIYNKVYDFLNVDLWEHASSNNCENLQSSGVGFGVLFLFLSFILAFWLSGKKTNPLYLFIAFLLSMFGYYFGEMVVAKDRSNEDKTYCSEFKETPKLTTNDSIKIIIYISFIILLFVGMNFFTQKLTKMEGSYEFVIIGVLFYLLLTYLTIIVKSLINVVDILYILINKKYYTSIIPNRWCDFLVSFTTILVFMSGVGLLITTCSNKLVSNFLNSFNVKDAFDWFSTSTFSSLISELPNEFVSFQENPITKTILFFLLLLYKFFQFIVILPEKLNSVYSDIGNYIEQNFLKASVTILVLEISIICLYLLVTKTYKSLNTSFVESIPLIKIPSVVFPSKSLNIDVSNIPQLPNIKKYEELPKEQPYTFGLSFSLFIEESGSLNYFIPILSYNNNPCVMYKPSANNLIVTIPKGYANVTEPVKNVKKETSEIINSYTILNSHIGTVIDDKYIVYSTTDVKLQKWMNIFINYNNGVIDIFLNGQLVNSSNINQIISEYSNTIVFGSENVEDTHIKINNLNFYNKDIGVDNILRINVKNYTE